jgi:hypothetical protein
MHDGQGMIMLMSRAGYALPLVNTRNRPRLCVVFETQRLLITLQGCTSHGLGLYITWEQLHWHCIMSGLLKLPNLQSEWIR